MYSLKRRHESVTNQNFRIFIDSADRKNKVLVKLSQGYSSKLSTGLILIEPSFSSRHVHSIIFHLRNMKMIYFSGLLVQIAFYFGFSRTLFVKKPGKQTNENQIHPEKKCNKLLHAAQEKEKFLERKIQD